MGVYDLKQAFPDTPEIQSLTMNYAGNGNQILSIGGRTIEVGPMASTEDIGQALANPWMENMSITGFEPGSIKAKLEALKQKAKDLREASLAKLDEAGTKHEAVNAELDRIAAQVSKEADDALQEFAQFSNGGPA
jgi:hypothetical protein